MERKTTIVIPNLNGEKILKKCLEALKRQSVHNFEVILMDNGSTDHSVDVAMEYGNCLNLTAICYDCNYGFAKAVNEGIRMAQTPYVLLLNNDTIPGKYMLENLEKEMERSSDIFAVQALMLQMTDHRRIDSAGDGFSAMGWGFASMHGRSVSLLRQTPQEIFSACAGAALYRRDLVLELGGFDEDYFAYLEDVDLGYRARLKGYRNVLSPKARVLHMGSSTTGSRYNAFKVELSARNSLLTCFKNMTGWQIVANMIPILTGIFIKTGFFATKGLAGDYLRGILDAIQRMPKTKRTNLTNVPDERLVAIEKELWRNVLRRLW